MTTSSSSKISLSPRLLSHSTPIEEGRISFMETTPSQVDYRHYRTPLHENTSSKKGKGSTRKRSESNELSGDHRVVTFNKCIPSNRDKFPVVPLPPTASPNGGIFKSIFSSLVKNTTPSPRSTDEFLREEKWKAEVAELSHKLIQATKKRDEAVLEGLRSKSSMAELEKKLNKLELYCQSLKSNLDVVNFQCVKVGDHERVIEQFLISVSEARSSIRVLSGALTFQLNEISRPHGDWPSNASEVSNPIGNGKVYDQISLLLQTCGIKISSSKNPKALLICLEALLNKVFFQDFESIGFQKSSSNKILNPIDRCEANFTMFSRLNGLTWEEVLSKGTKQFSEEFSKFCDRKMSEIVGLLNWNHAWHEQLLQAFFGASKGVWLVHLLANSVHPSLPIFRVDKNVRFDSIYMEDMVGINPAQNSVPTMVRIMVTPGFYIYDNVVKCKVLCRYYSNVCSDDRRSDKGLTFSPTT